METLLSTFTEERGNQQDQNFSQDDNDITKKKEKEREQQNQIIAIQKSKRVIYCQMFLIEDLSKKILIMQALSVIFCCLLCSTLLLLI